jgi:tetratricopeptide (TPR) repeat protein
VDRPLADRLVGSRVGHYDVLARLGGGGMGVVYSARDTRLGRLAALKFLPPQWSHDETAKQRFLREAQAASATDHPNICTIYDIGATDDGQLFIAMAYCQGETLKQRLERGPLPVEEALDVATQVADGLAKAHAAGVVHRDVKPGNLILTEDAVKIVDFGLAKFADSLQLTVAQSTLGTAAYMSPEQVRGEEADARSDLWALGVVLYEMLAGHVPFRGTYAEAIAYAIRTEAPPSLRANRPEIPEDVEHIVFRALHKDPAIRFQSARDMARALRRTRGLTLPVDLRTEAVVVPPAVGEPRSTRRGRLTRSARWVAAALLAVFAVGLWWVLRTPPRMAIVIAPVSNQTGDPELDAYGRALTLGLIAWLSPSRDVRPLAYQRTLQPLWRFIGPGGNVSSRDAIQALASDAGTDVVIVPVFSYENNAWLARAEIRSAVLGTNEGPPSRTAPRESALNKDAAYQLVGELATVLEERFKSPSSRVRDWLAARFRGDPEIGDAHLRGLDTLEAFERGIAAYESIEYAEARRAFMMAAERDPRHPLPAAWLARILLQLGQRNEALDAASRAMALIGPATLRHDALFVEAVAAEAHDNARVAETRYRQLIALFPDEPAWVIELAAFQDRAERAADAVASYHAALAADPRFVRPQLELCRLYNSTRMNEAGLAKKHGEHARTAYAAVGHRMGEAQSLLCLADILRVGDSRERTEARHAVDEALRIFEERRAAYNVARALNFAALVGARDDLPGAVRLWEQTLVAAQEVGNTFLVEAVLTNLGVAHNALGNREQALEYYRRSYDLNTQLGDERGAAYSRANAGALLIEFGEDPEQGRREVENALTVLQKLGDRNFEVLCRQVISAYYRASGRYDEAERELNVALTIARDHGFEDRLESLTIDRGRILVEMSRYEDARAAFADVIAKGPGPRRAEALIEIARVDTLLGDFGSARAASAQAAEEVGIGHRLDPRLQAALGELAYEAGEWQQARSHYARAAEGATGSLIDAARVEARGRLGLLDALAGRVTDGTRAIQECVDRARQTRHASLETRCRVFLARALLFASRPSDALAALQDPPDADLPKELLAQLHRSRADAYDARGEAAMAQQERQTARETLEQVLHSIPRVRQPGFLERSDVRSVLR